MRSRASAPPTPPKPSANGSRPPSPRPWSVAGRSPPRPSCHHHTKKGKDRGKGRARDTKGDSGKTARRGPK